MLPNYKQDNYCCEWIGSQSHPTSNEWLQQQDGINKQSTPTKRAKQTNEMVQLQNKILKKNAEIISLAFSENQKRGMREWSRIIPYFDKSTPTPLTTFQPSLDTNQRSQFLNYDASRICRQSIDPVYREILDEIVLPIQDIVPLNQQIQRPYLK